MPITIAGSGTITGISAGGLPDDSIVTADIANGAVTQAKRSEDLTLGTAQNSTSGTSIDFTGIPSWVKRVTVIFNGVSTNGTSVWLIRLGSGSIQATGYVGAATSGATITSNTTGAVVNNNVTAAQTFSGHCVFTNVSGNVWVSSGITQAGATNAGAYSASSVTLSGSLDQLRITTVNGTDAFDAGTINIMYE